jgi:hypothetical protein
MAVPGTPAVSGGGVSYVMSHMPGASALVEGVSAGASMSLGYDDSCLEVLLGSLMCGWLKPVVLVSS